MSLVELITLCHRRNKYILKKSFNHDCFLQKSRNQHINLTSSFHVSTNLTGEMALWQLFSNYCVLLYMFLPEKECILINVCLSSKYIYQHLFIYLSIKQHYSGISFIGGGNQSIRRKPPTCSKSLTNFIT
jgi:hypothetical protein